MSTKEYELKIELNSLWIRVDLNKIYYRDSESVADKRFWAVAILDLIGKIAEVENLISEFAELN